MVSYWCQCLQNCWNIVFPRVSFLLSSETIIEGTKKSRFIYFNSRGNWHMVHQTHSKKWRGVGNSVVLTRCTLRICFLQSANFNICKRNKYRSRSCSNYQKDIGWKTKAQGWFLILLWTSARPSPGYLTSWLVPSGRHYSPPLLGPCEA